jgi:F420-non-reducing hydrogenase large subunit
MARSCVEFARFSLKLFADVVLASAAYMDLVKRPELGLALYNMGTVDGRNRVALYDGTIRVTAPDGGEFLRFEGKDYLEHVRERVVDWSYVKIPYLSRVGFKGLVDGPESGLYRVGPLGRLNAADGMATDGADAEYRRMFETFGTKPVTSTLAYHWARLIELLYAAERAVELAADPAITGTDLRNLEFRHQPEGVGVVEAARGTLFHHYRLTEDRLVEKVNLIVATTNNKGAICMSVRNAARQLIRRGRVDDGLLNTVEMFFRAYDPCFGCASHVLGRVPLQVDVRGPDGGLVRRLGAA